MLRSLTVAAATAIVLSGAVITAPTAAADVTCRGTLSSPVGDTVIVPSGATCTITTTVDGDVKVSSGASVTLRGASVEGNVQAESARAVAVTNSRIDGDLQAKYTSTSVSVSGTRVGGNIQLEEGRAAIALSSNTVDGDIQLFKNPAGAKSVNSNIVNGNLQCKENRPAPTGSRNVVRGSAEDQCRGLTGTGGGGGGGGSTVDIYLTPGTHHVNGRTWRTTCEPYSTTRRCRTEIKATTVSYTSGRFVQSTGWVFNNLTYAPIPRSTWGKNPLANKGSWTGADGRKWRTDCDSAVTGRNGCRSYATAKVIEYRGGTYQWVTKEILNNMVRFA